MPNALPLSLPSPELERVRLEDRAGAHVADLDVPRRVPFVEVVVWRGRAFIAHRWDGRRRVYAEHSTHVAD